MSAIQVVPTTLRNVAASVRSGIPRLRPGGTAHAATPASAGMTTAVSLTPSASAAKPMVPDSDQVVEVKAGEVTKLKFVLP